MITEKHTVIALLFPKARQWPACRPQSGCWPGFLFLPGKVTSRFDRDPHGIRRRTPVGLVGLGHLDKPGIDDPAGEIPGDCEAVAVGETQNRAAAACIPGITVSRVVRC
jgi:hypothetical protein